MHRIYARLVSKYLLSLLVLTVLTVPTIFFLAAIIGIEVTKINTSI